MRDRRSVSEAAYQALYQAISAAVVCGIVFAAAAARAQAQPSPDMQQVLDRLDRLETQNRELMTEIHALRLNGHRAGVVAFELPCAFGVDFRTAHDRRAATRLLAGIRQRL